MEACLRDLFEFTSCTHLRVSSLEALGLAAEKGILHHIVQLFLQTVIVTSFLETPGTQMIAL